MKRQPAPKFPLVITKGHASVKIYRTQNRGRELFCLSYVAPSGRVRQNFVDFEEAKREAATKVAQLAQGDIEATKLTGQDRQLYVAAVEAIRPTGISLDIAAREFAEAFKILGHDAIIEAARYYRKNIDTDLPDVTVTDAVARFSEAKASEGMSRLYLKDIRVMLGRFAETFRCNLQSVTADDLQDYMKRLGVGPVSRNNHRRLIVALFNFAKAQGWLRKAEATPADALGAVKVKAKDVEIYTPAEVAALLAAAGEKFLPWLLFIAFGGVRREELAKGLAWESVDFENTHLVVPAGIAKTGKKRKIDLAENLLAWLAPYRGRKGAIFAQDARKQMAKVSEAAGVAWKRNALRHSFGSYRMEATKNAGQVALEMGNSPKVVMEHYHEIVTAKQSAAYWSILPAAA